MKIRFCTKCPAISERPRITFNKEGVCNACEWSEKKRKIEINWDERRDKLNKICDRFRCNDGSNWDVLVPCSGGKDGTYVAWKLKHELGMHPLCVTMRPMLRTKIGQQNLDIHITALDQLKSGAGNKASNDGGNYLHPRIGNDQIGQNKGHPYQPIGK